MLSEDFIKEALLQLGIGSVRSITPTIIEQKVAATETKYINEDGDNIVYVGIITGQIDLVDTYTGYLKLYEAKDSTVLKKNLTSDVSDSTYNGLKFYEFDNNTIQVFSKLELSVGTGEGDAHFTFAGYKVNF